MKNNRLMKFLVFACVLLVFAGCKKEKNLITEYIGTVVEENTMNPLSNVKVSVTDGTRVIASTMTDESGTFSFLVNFEKVNDNDSLLLDGSPYWPYQKRFALKGMGQEQYNYGTLILGNGLKSFQFAGTTYYVHPDVGKMNWESAMAFCDNLVYAGYSDWFLPNEDELNAMYVYRNSIGGFVTTSGTESYYWSSTTTYILDDGVYYMCQAFDDGAHLVGGYNSYNRVRPVRKEGGGNPGGGGGNSQTVVFDFDSGSDGWTTIDADGDGYAWVSSRNPGNYHNNGVNLEGSGHNGSAHYMLSGSWINQPGQALTPDNYLVSTERYALSDGASISFYVCAQDAGYAAEHYGVAISTASTPTASSFVTIWEETLSAKEKANGKTRGGRDQGNWYFKTVDLSSYAGQSVWIAIRHFNCTDHFIINVDDVVIVKGGG